MDVSMDKDRPNSDVDMSDGEIRDEPVPSDSTRHVGSLASARLTHSMSNTCDPPPDFEVVGGSIRARTLKRPSPPAFELITRSGPPRSCTYRDSYPSSRSRSHPRRTTSSIGVTDSYIPDSPSDHAPPRPDGILEFRGNKGDSAITDSLDFSYARRDMDSFHSGPASRLPRRSRGYHDSVNVPPGPPSTLEMTTSSVDTYIPAGDRHEHDRDRDRNREYYPLLPPLSRDHRDRPSRNGPSRDSYQPNGATPRYVDYRDSPVDSYMPGRTRRSPLTQSPRRLDDARYVTPTPSVAPLSYHGEYNASQGATHNQSGRSRSPPPRRRGSLLDEYVPGDGSMGLPPRPSRSGGGGSVMDSYIPRHPPPLPSNRSSDDRYHPHYDHRRHSSTAPATTYDTPDRYVPGYAGTASPSGQPPLRIHHDDRYIPGGSALDDRYVPIYAPRGGISSPFPPVPSAARRTRRRSWSRSASRSRSRTFSTCSRSRSVSITSSPNSRSLSPHSTVGIVPPMSPSGPHYPFPPRVGDAAPDFSLGGRPRRRRGGRKHSERNTTGLGGGDDDVSVAPINSYRPDNRMDEPPPLPPLPPPPPPAPSLRTPSLALPARPGVGPKGDVLTGMDDSLVESRPRDLYRPGTRGSCTRSGSMSPSRSSPMVAVPSHTASSLIRSPSQLHGDDHGRMRSPRWSCMTGHGIPDVNGCNGGAPSGWDEVKDFELVRIRSDSVATLHAWMSAREITNKAALRAWVLAMEQARVAALVGLYSSMDMGDYKVFDRG